MSPEEVPEIFAKGETKTFFSLSVTPLSLYAVYKKNFFIVFFYVFIFFCIYIFFEREATSYLKLGQSLEKPKMRWVQ